jgi:AraC-like DNA-binding protein/quercetin dioxygenase-like cupin family protein
MRVRTGARPDRNGRQPQGVVGGERTMKPHVAIKPMFEKVLPTQDCSWRYFLYELEAIPFNWHYHPEYEIALTLDGHGSRYVGDSIETYAAGDLALLGPNLPHTWYSHPSLDGQRHRVHVAQIPAGWLESLAERLPEMAPLGALLAKSKRGLVFGDAVSAQCRRIFATMQRADPLEKFVGLLQVLKFMLDDPDARLLSSSGYVISTAKDASLDRIEKVIRYIHTHYTQELRAEQLAQHAHMSVSHFHRFIKQRTEQTFNELVTELRVGKACALLLNGDLPIATVCSLSGFNNLSNFNRRFQQIKGVTPSAFRRAYCAGRVHAPVRHLDARATTAA